MNKTSPIGVFDSGIGGLSVLKQFIRFLPYEKYVYLGDTARVPYGNKSKDTVIEYSKQCVNYLLSHDVKLIVVACNTASSNALEEIKAMTDIPVIGMIVPAAQAALRITLNNKIGVIGTRATINSKSYERTINELSNKEIQVFSEPCPLFVPIVEEGWIRHKATRLIAEEYLASLTNHNVDTLVLGCTHYPLLSELIKEIMPSINLIDSGEHSSVSAIRILGEAGLLAEEREDYNIKHDIKFYVTDVQTIFYDVSKLFLGFEIDSPIKVVISP